ncbi:unnamed protein product [Staurois parvus]|uniref:Uncharacterized protein n=1 Tax=Staurois parvus TaxID=386267 RepID=A0ABN9G6J7_9NEOB|nr:unnamed protein product [Staurois parvus]
MSFSMLWGFGMNNHVLTEMITS